MVSKGRRVKLVLCSSYMFSVSKDDCEEVLVCSVL